MDCSSPDTELYDAITFNLIRPGYCVTTQSGNFDVETLYRYYHDNKLKKPLDPFNRQPLSREDSRRVIRYEETQQLTVSITYLTAIFGTDTISFNTKKHKSVGSIICHMLTNISYLSGYSQQPRHMTDMIEYDIILSNMSSLYDMDLELPLELNPTTKSVTVNLLRASNRKMNSLVLALTAFTSTRIYDSDANYMAIAHYCGTYKPRKEVCLTAIVRQPKTAFYNDELDKYFDANGVEIPELNN